MELSKHDLELANCLRRLLRSRFLLRSTNQKWFQIVVDLRQKVQEHLNAMALQLDINEALGVIYLRPQSEETEELISYQIGRRKVLSLYASLLMFHLRQSRLAYFLNPTGSEAPFVSHQDLRDFLENFNFFKIDSQFEKAFRKAVEEMKDCQILLETKEGSGVYEITSITDLLLPADQIQTYLAKIKTYLEANKGSAGPADDFELMGSQEMKKDLSSTEGSDEC